MALDVLTFGEALVEIMRVELDVGFDRPGLFDGPYPSGAPFIFAVQAARLGAKAGCIGAVGADHFGRFLLNSLRDEGVELSCVHTLDGYATGIAFIAYQRDGSRDYVFHVRHDAAGQFRDEMLDPALFEGLRCLHLTGSTLSIHDGALAFGFKMLEMAREAGAKISFDPNLRPQLMPVDQARSNFAPFIEAADVILPTAEELQLLTGAATTEDGAQRLLAARAGRIIVVSAGRQGSTVYTMESGQLRAEHVPAFTVDEIDPTGAGDCFDAGFLIRWLAGDSPAEAARYANACGALAVTVKGPMSGARAADVEAFIRAQA